MSPSLIELFRGLAKMKAAMPDGNTWPKNEKEWKKALAALEQMGFALYLQGGMPTEEARSLARITHGGPAKRLLLEIAQQADRKRYA